jgi:hypothetical protein
MHNLRKVVINFKKLSLRDIFGERLLERVKTKIQNMKGEMRIDLVFKNIEKSFLSLVDYFELCEMQNKTVRVLNKNE